MNLIVAIDDSKVVNFTPGAKETLQNTCNDYANAIVDETKNIEKAERATNASTEVISSHIKEAEKKYRKPSPKSKKSIIIQALVDILIFLCGILFDKDKLINSNGFLIFYIVLVVATIVFLVFKYSMGE